MACWRMDLQRKMAAYLHGSLSPDSSKEIEVHLTGCGSCRSHLSKMKEADRIARQLPAVTASPDSWSIIESTIARNSRTSGGRSSFLMKPLIAYASMIVAVLTALILWRTSPGFSERNEDFDPTDFRAISLSQFSQTVEPHVATEGYVSQISVDNEDGDLMFKLVDDLHRPNHFVVCEIIAPLKLTAPPPGSRIRVYGVSRYDGKAEHQWFEVHPVLNIEPIR
jgi:Putative zinc-finger